MIVARFAGSPKALMIIIAVPAGLVIAGVLGWLADWRLGVDSAVYRSGALALLGGEPLYDANTLAAEPFWALLPFTYPPTAALLFVPLAGLPTQVAWGVLGALSVLGMALVIRITLARVPRRPTWLAPGRVTVVFAVLLLGLEPVWRTIFLGQINLVLMAIVVLDVLVLAESTGRARRWAGVLVGVAAAVKLTPLIFIPHLLCTGRRAEAARAFGTFVALQGLVFLLAPGDMLGFWGHAVTDPGRTGPTFWIGNQSLNGLISRVSGLAPWSETLAIVVGAALAIPVVLLMLRFHRQGKPLYALLVTAFYGLLLSPVSWSHHYVWAVPLVVALIARLPEKLPTGTALVGRLAGAVGVIAVFASGVLLWTTNGRGAELTWSPWVNLPGNAYLLVPVIAGIVLLVRLARARAHRPEAPREPDGSGAPEITRQPTKASR